MSVTDHFIFTKNTPPSTSDESPTKLLGQGQFPYHRLMGEWIIVGSSLKLWKDRSDVLCRYTPHELPDRNKKTKLTFSDEIWWEQLDKDGTHKPGKGASRNKRSIVRGRNVLDPNGSNGASFLWRGYNFLKPFTSRWQVLAFSQNFVVPDEERRNQPIWLVTYFTATLFTDAGIDLYVRGKLSENEYNEIVAALKSYAGQDEPSKELKRLAEQLFKVPEGKI